MRNITFSSFVITIAELLFIFHSSKSFSSDFFNNEFKCENRRGNVPDLPKAFEVDVKFNFVDKFYTVEIIYGRNSKLKKEFIQFRSTDRQVRYIIRKDEGVTLYIEYQDNKHPTCTVIKSTDMKDFIRNEDAGKNHILLKTLEVMLSPTQYNIYSTGPSLETGVTATKYDGCLKDPLMNISMTFPPETWKMSHSKSSQENNLVFPETIAVAIGKDLIGAFSANFDPSGPNDIQFQPPPNVFCKGFRTKKTPPKMPDYFSFSAEVINYRRNKMGMIVPMITQRKVYYDYKDNISRIDINDLLAPNSDTETTAQKKSIIHDFNAGMQYLIDSTTGKCLIDTFQETFSIISFQQTEDNRMFTGAEYFWLDNVETSYNGQISQRGVMVDVYTALRIEPKTRNPYIITWFFSAEATQVAENEYVEKNVLLSMSLRPETEFREEEKAEIHLFDFSREEPDVFNFDLTKCYNESSSKTLVFTFPSFDELRGSEKLIGRLLNIAIKDVTGIRKHRIFTKEVIFSGKYMYTEFSLLDDSPIKTNSSGKRISLDEALQKLQDSVSKGDFKVNIPVENTTVWLKPEPNGLNVFAGDRPRMSGDEGYKEGSVVAITIGMLLLGFLLGGVTINLIVSRKYGVSLFQRSGAGGKRNQHPLQENSF